MRKSKTTRAEKVVARRLIKQLHHRLQIKPTHYLEIIIDWTSTQSRLRLKIASSRFTVAMDRCLSNLVGFFNR